MLEHTEKQREEDWEAVKQREAYWEAVNILRALVEGGIDRDELLEEVDDDL